jgi:hypothetical protein
MRLDVLDQHIVGLAFDVRTARAVDDLHISLLDRWTNETLPPRAPQARRVRDSRHCHADPLAGSVWIFVSPRCSSPGPACGSHPKADQPRRSFPTGGGSVNLTDRTTPAVGGRHRPRPTSPGPGLAG